LTRSALTEMRSLLVELRPPALVNGDLAELLKNLTESLKSRKHIQVMTDVHVGGKLSVDEQIALYRIAQEALNNISKHAAATQVSLRVCSDANQFDLSIEDNGCGFDPTRVPAAHFGLGVMRERAEAIGATFPISRVPGGGTRLQVTRI